MKYLFAFPFMLLNLCVSLSCLSQDIKIELWPEGIPNSRPSKQKEIQAQGEELKILSVTNVQIPTLQAFFPARQNATGQAVVICPGGSYRMLAYDWEGTDIAKWLNSKGIAAFVLKYRLPLTESVVIGRDAPIQDARRAIRTVRHNAKAWGLDENKIGVMGFSAGGHLASTLATQYSGSTLSQKDAIDTLSARPDFVGLIYPVITMRKPYTHIWSRKALLGDSPSKALIDQFSNELNVDENTPPTFIVHSADDKPVPVENSLHYYSALVKHNVYAEMHVYPIGGHGYSLGIKKGHLQTWPDRFVEWLGSF